MTRRAWGLFVLLLCTILLALSAPLAYAQDTWNGPDKKLHFGVSALLGVAARSQWPDAPVKAWAWAMIPGVLKELSDSAKGGSGFSYRDLTADALGAVVGVAVVGLFVGPRSVSYQTRF